MPRQKYRIIELDPQLKPFEADIELRMRLLEEKKQTLLGGGKTLSDFANGHLYFGFHKTTEGWYYREWAPNAREIHLFGDFNGWNRAAHPMTKLDGGVWEIFIPKVDSLPHGSKIRIEIKTDYEVFERIPLYCKRVIQNPNDYSFDGQIWDSEKPFEWSDKDFTLNKNQPLFIYECHVGMSGEKEGITTYIEFEENILPRVKKLGYNTVQLMAIMEHPYYGSFGYQVSNFFAASSRFGTPEELKSLINTAHKLGVTVLLDLVHSHAAKNEVEGLGRFDGTEYQFFHSGARGNHPQWGSKLFDYNKPEVVHFLLSNLKFWLEEYHFDGFRFDGITSMLYHDHGLGVAFDNYNKYFSLNTDTDAITYLQLAATLCKEVNKNCILIAEDMSGMPGMALAVEDGGIGFDYRLGMGMPDYWISNLKNKRDEDWDIGKLWYELNQRRPGEKVIGYCESHDQALVGDKTIIFWLADKEMYWNMSKDSQSIVIDRAISLHKLIRLISCTCGGEGYLTFMGNEFGHPEWVDFPRAGNNDNYYYARRRWSLAADPLLRYQFLENFDIAMIKLAEENNLLSFKSELILHHNDGMTLVYTKAGYMFLFNFHPTDDIEITVSAPAGQQLDMVLNSNWSLFGGNKNKFNYMVQEQKGRFNISLDKRSAKVYRIVEAKE